MERGICSVGLRCFVGAQLGVDENEAWGNIYHHVTKRVDYHRALILTTSPSMGRDLAHER